MLAYKFSLAGLGLEAGSMPLLDVLPSESVSTWFPWFVPCPEGPGWVTFVGGAPDFFPTAPQTSCCLPCTAIFETHTGEGGARCLLNSTFFFCRVFALGELMIKPQQNIFVKSAGDEDILL